MCTISSALNLSISVPTSSLIFLSQLRGGQEWETDGEAFLADVRDLSIRTKSDTTQGQHRRGIKARRTCQGARLEESTFLLSSCNFVTCICGIFDSACFRMLLNASVKCVYPMLAIGSPHSACSGVMHCLYNTKITFWSFPPARFSCSLASFEVREP